MCAHACMCICVRVCLCACMYMCFPSYPFLFPIYALKIMHVFALDLCMQCMHLSSFMVLREKNIHSCYRSQLEFMLEFQRHSEDLHFFHLSN